MVRNPMCSLVVPSSSSPLTLLSRPLAWQSLWCPCTPCTCACAPAGASRCAWCTYWWWGPSGTIRERSACPPYVSSCAYLQQHPWLLSVVNIKLEAKRNISIHPYFFLYLFKRYFAFATEMCRSKFLSLLI